DGGGTAVVMQRAFYSNLWGSMTSGEVVYTPYTPAFDLSGGGPVMVSGEYELPNYANTHDALAEYVAGYNSLRARPAWLRVTPAHPRWLNGELPPGPGSTLEPFRASVQSWA